MEHELDLVFELRFLAMGVTIRFDGDGFRVK